MPTPDSQPQNLATRLASETIHAGDKKLYVDLKENPRGKHFRITEDNGGRRTAIVIPLTVAAEVVAAMNRLHQHHTERPDPT